MPFPETLTSPAIRSAIPFTMADQEVLLAFRRRLRRKVIWAVVTTAHAQLPEALDIYRPYEVPEHAVPTWIVWRTPDGAWLYDQEIGALGTPTLGLALEFIEVAGGWQSGSYEGNPGAAPSRISPAVPG